MIIFSHVLNLMILFFIVYLPFDYGSTTTLSHYNALILSCLIIAFLCLLAAIKYQPSYLSVKFKTNYIHIIAVIFLSFFLLMQIMPLGIGYINGISHDYYNDEFLQFKYISIDILKSIPLVLIWISALALYLSIIILLSKKKSTQLLLFIFISVLVQFFLDYWFRLNNIMYIDSQLLDGHFNRLTGTFINSNHLSALTNLGCFSMLSFLFLNSSINYKVAYLLSFVIIFFIAFMLVRIGSNAGLIAPMLAICINMVFILRSIIVNWKYLIAGLILLLICVLGFIIYFPNNEISLTSLTDFDSLNDRIGQWMLTLLLIKDTFLTGVGLGNYEWAFVSYKSDMVMPFRYFHAHNTWIELYVEIGFIMSTLIMIYMGYIWLRLFTQNYNNLSRRESIGIFSLALGLTTFIIQASLDSMFVSIAIFYLLVIYLAITINISNHYNKKYN